MADTSQLEGGGKPEPNTSSPNSTVPPKRASTKPIAPRSSTLTKPTSTSAARTTTGASLNKPPARPAVSSARKPLSSTTTSAHKQQSSISSVDGRSSPVEKKKDGISARPKRMSLSSSTAPERTTTTKPATTTPPRRTNAPPTTARRTTTTSPLEAKKPTATATHRAPLGSSARSSRPPASATNRNAAVVPGQKRLSTIPASPAVRGLAGESAEDKENADSSLVGKSPVRPSLGSRKSTRSVLIEQRIREFEIVNRMLQSAMAADGVSEDEQEIRDREATDTMTKLRADLAKVRAFEKQHGRMPNEDELAKVELDQEDLAQEPELSTILEQTSAPALEGQDVNALQIELADRRTEVENLQSLLKDMTSKMAAFSIAAEAEGSRVQASADGIRTEHKGKIHDLSDSHDKQLKEISDTHKTELEGLKLLHVSELEAMRSSHDKWRIEKEAELEKARAQAEKERSTTGTKILSQESNIKDLQQQIETLSDEKSAEIKSKEDQLKELRIELESQKSKLEEANRKTAMEEPSIVHKEELESLQKKIADEQAKTVAAEQKVNTKIQEVKAEADRRLTESDQKISELKTRSEKAEFDVSNKSGENAKLREAHAKALENIDNEMSRQTQVIKTLQNELVAFNQSKAKESTAQNNKIQKLEEQILVLEQMKDAAAKDSISTLEAHQKSYSEEKSTLEKRLQSAIEDLEKNSVSHETSKQEALSTAKSELEAIKTTHDEALRKLQAQLDSAENHSVAQRTAHADEISSLQSQLGTSQGSLKDITSKHQEQLKLFDSQGSQAQLELAEAKSVHEKALLQQATEANKAHEKALNGLKETHQEQITSYEAQVQKLQSDLDATKAQQTKLLNEMQSQSASAQAEALDVLKTAHAKQLEDVEAQSRVNQEQSLEKLRTTYSEQISQLESRSKSAAADIDAAKFQVQSLKNILQSVEDESKGKDEEHNQALERLEGEIATSVMKLAEQSSRMADLQQEQEKRLAEARRTIEAENQQSIKSLHAEHDDANSKIRKDLEAKHAELVSSMRAEHEKGLASSLEANKAQNVEANKKLQQEYEGKLRHLEETLVADHSTNITGLQEEQAKAISSKDEEHSAMIRKTKDDHEVTLAKLMSELEDAKKLSENVSSDSEINELNDKLTEAQEATGLLQQKHDKELALMKKSHESALLKMQGEIEKSLTDMQKRIDKDMAAVKTEHENEKKKLEAQLTNAHSAAARSEQLSSEHERIKAELNQAQDKVLELDEQLQGALLEIETQRSLADQATEQVEHMKAAHQEVAENESGDPKKADEHHPKPNDHFGNGTANSKAGLESSRWAVKTEDDEKAVPDASPDSKTAETASGNEKPSVHIDADADKPVDGTSKKRRNLEGQLAGIQEQIKQLDEISGDFLEEHQRMAKTLNKHNDTTSALTTGPEE